jgi:hypothetical protein
MSCSPPSLESGPPFSVDFKLIDRARAVFEKAFPAEALPATWRHGNRTFTICDYLGFMLLGLYVPTCDSLRGLCKASELQMFQERYQCFSMDLASVSKAQAHVPEELLIPIITELSGEVQKQNSALRERHGEKNLTADGETQQLAKYILQAVDSSVFQALPKMTWALFGAGRARKDGRKTASVRYHVSFDALALCPTACAVTSAAVDEKQRWKDILPISNKSAEDSENGPQDRRHVQVGDRNFGSNYTTLHDLTEGDISFVVRIKESAQIEVHEDIPLSETEKSAGIIRHAWVQLGLAKKNQAQHRVRLIWLERPDKVIVLATNLTVEDAAALTIAEMYRHRWQIEFFFWWLKKILKVGHWLAQSEKGVRIQLYLVMILALLLQLQTGRRPTKRMIELLHFYAQGLASEQELLLGLQERAREADLARESSRKRYLAKKQASGK